jgi:hypothetical protein
MAFAVTTDYLSQSSPAGNGVTFNGSWSGIPGGDNIATSGFNWGYSSTSENFVNGGHAGDTNPSGSFTGGAGPVSKDVNILWFATATLELSGLSKSGATSTDKLNADPAVLATPTVGTPAATSCPIADVITAKTVSSVGQVSVFYKKASDTAYTQTGVLATLDGSVPTSVPTTLTGLTPSTAYNFYYQISRNTANLNIATSVVGGFTTAAPQAPPTAPSNLVVTSITASSVSLAWTDNSSGEDGFKVYHCTGASGCTPGTLVFTSGPNVTSFTDTNLVASTLYRYAVYAFSAGGSSNTSNIVTATTLGSDPIVSCF